MPISDDAKNIIRDFAVNGKGIKLGVDLGFKPQQLAEALIIGICMSAEEHYQKVIAENIIANMEEALTYAKTFC